ncbi:coiled-coil domain-containing protein [Novipirellula artificiosorum]|uniref:Uncharacterized protein n=1 Tax=Novipirellula artificiosorum TaxID=2528016 RepID=A0A5C6DB18_9BACT|nr:hypothetical protein [Novipirellula artificiosorum]TWU33355.1 hypothetical protein Poly41_51090 [Novipirellula artificiosorum]
MNLMYTESEVQTLKAQEAKDYCVALMRQLEARSEGPISAGEVQLQELQYELELKQAETEDNRQREAHLERIKDLELEIEREKAEFSRSEKQTDEVRQRQVQVIQQVSESQEKLSIALDRATREHHVKLQMMQAEHDAKREALQNELHELTDKRDTLIEQIGKLADLSTAADDVDRLRAEIEQKRLEALRQQKDLDEQTETTVFEKEKELKRIRREHDIALAERNAAHRKLMLDANLEAADGLLSELGFTRIAPAEYEHLKQQAESNQTRSEQEVQAIEAAAIDEFRKRFSISSNDPIDVTELYYRERALQEENQSHEQQIAKLESEIARMRTHIESESTRVAKAIEAARTNIQNNIEPGVKR